MLNNMQMHMQSGSAHWALRANFGTELHSNNHLLVSLSQLFTLWHWRGTGRKQQELCWGLLEELSVGENMSRSNWQQDQVAIKELQLILDSCKLGLTPVDEVWPNLYIGNV